MAHSNELIERRAQEIFAREHQESGMQWRAEFVERGSGTVKPGAGEGLRQELRDRAGAELIAEGLIDYEPAV